MSSALLSSKVAIEEEQPEIRTIDAVQTSIVACVGVTERGPIGVPTLTTDWEEYKAIFGGYTANSDVALAAAGFFENEGQFLYVVRVVHYSDPSNPASKTSAPGTATLQTATGAPTAGVLNGTNFEPFALTNGQTLAINVDGAGAATATFNAAAATVLSTNTGTYNLTNGWTLQFQVDGGPLQTVIFNTAEFANIAAATPAEVAAVINAEATGARAVVESNRVRITSDLIGTDSSLTGFAGTAASALGFSASNSGTGDVADISQVSIAEIKAVVEADVPAVTVNDVSGAVQFISETTGPSSSVQIAAGALATILGLDSATHSGTTGAAVNTLRVDGKTDGAYANTLQVVISAATSGVSTEFNLTLLDDGIVVERFVNLSMVDGSARYVEDVLNVETGGSKLVTVTDLDASLANQRPANGTFGPLSGGDDGLAGLVDADFIGDEAGQTGIRALDTVQEVNILIVPNQATAAVQNAMVTYCEITRDMSIFPIFGPPAGLSATEVITYFETTAGLLGLSEFGAAYWPRPEVTNPSVAVFGQTPRIVVDPVGIIAGVYARTDAARPGGIYDPPAGIEKGIMYGVLGFETKECLDEKKRDLVAPKRINILTTFPGAPRHIDGSYCLKGGGNFPFVSQRRGAIFIEQSVKNGTEFARNQNNTPKLRRTVERSIRAFLIIQMDNEAFASKDPDTAFYVNFSVKLNPPSQVTAGRMNGRVGLAFNTPAVWIVIRFSRDTRALEAELAG